MYQIAVKCITLNSYAICHHYAMLTTCSSLSRYYLSLFNAWGCIQKPNKCADDNGALMNESAFAMGWLAGIGAIIAFATLLGEPVSAQQQTSSADAHHVDNNSQSGGSSTIQQQQNTTTTSSEMVMMSNQTFNTAWTSFVSGVKVTGV
jgi:hypothetical protein